MTSDTALVEQISWDTKCPSSEFLPATAAQLNKFPLTKREMTLLTSDFTGNFKSPKAAFCFSKTNMSTEAKDGGQFISNGLPNVIFPVRFWRQMKAKIKITCLS